MRNTAGSVALPAMRGPERSVLIGNAPALYRRFGFMVEGTLQGDAVRDGRLVEAHTMARLVDPAGMAR